PRQTIQALRTNRLEQSKILFACLLPCASYLYLFDHFVRSRQNIRWNRQADLFRCFEVDDELEFCRLLDWQVGGLGPLQNFVHICSGAAVQVGQAHAVGHKPTSFDPFRKVVYRRQSALYCEVKNPCSMRTEHRTRQHDESVSPPLACGSEGSLNILGV